MKTKTILTAILFISFVFMRTTIAFGQCQSSSRTFSPMSRDKFGLINETMDKKSFQEIGKYYAKDNKHVYFNYVQDIGSAMAVIVETYYLIEGADPKTFSVMSDEAFSQDKFHVYYEGFLIESADIKNFKILNPRYSKDANHVFYRDCRLSDVDMTTFKVVGDGGYYSYAYDKKYLYFHKDKTAIDIKTFKGLADNKCGDKNYIYWLTQEHIEKEKVK